jgi:hypothetical protein
MIYVCDQDIEIIPKEKLIGILKIPMSFGEILHATIYLFISTSVLSERPHRLESYMA